MSQHDYDIANGSGAAFRADLNLCLAAGVQLNSGASAPATTFAGMLWHDTTNLVVKQRNAANSAWITRWTVANAEGVFTTTLTAAAINASGLIACTGIAGVITQGMNFGGTATAAHYLDFVNTGGRLILGVENSTGNGLAFGSPGNYATVLTSVGNTQLALGTNSYVGLRIADGGGSAPGGVTIPGTLGVSTGAAVGGATPGTGGLAFPATAVAVADANTLDDYEEGTWTPNQGAGLTVVGAFSSSGTYTKIGRQVTINGQVSGATSIAAAAGAAMTGNVPFTTSANCVGGVAEYSATAGSVAVLSGTTVFPCAAIAATPTIYFTVTFFV